MALPPYKVNFSVMKDGKGAYRAAGLFAELFSREEHNAPALFTTSPNDDEVNGLHSFKKIYMSFEDTTEYDQAIALVGSMAHWERLTTANRVKDLIQECREEHKARTKSRALKRIMEFADNSPSDAVRYQAQKFLVKEGYALMEPEEAKTPGKRGRPSKAEIDGNLKAMTAEEKQIMDDYNRVLQIVQ
jgi:hypothetical protein